jgi:hypothetical protein
MTYCVHARANALAIVAAASILAACADSTQSAPNAAPRTYMMGFSNFPPAPDTSLQRRSAEMWLTRADAAIMHIDPPWAALLAGADADSLVRADVLPLKSANAQLGKLVVIETDDPQVAPIIHLELVDPALTPKPALAQWDSVFSRELNAGLP